MKRGLGVVLAASLLAAWWVAGLDEGDRADSTAGGRRPRVHRVARPALDAAGLGFRGDVEMRGDAARHPRDLFAPRSFLPPPAPPPPSRPSVALAPPLPYRYSGMLEDGGGLAVFLADQERLRVARVGDVLDGRYRVAAVSRSRIDFVYLPLNQTLSLATGAMP